MPSTKVKRIRQGWRAGSEFLKLQVLLKLFVFRLQVSQGLNWGIVDKLAGGLCSNAFGAGSFIG